MSRGFEILNMFDRASWLTIIESAVESTDCAVESPDSMADSSADSVKISLWVWALNSTGSVTHISTKLLRILRGLIQGEDDQSDHR